MRVGQALQRARQALAPQSETAVLEARLLLADTLGRPVAWLLAHDQDPLSESHRRAFDGRLRRRLSGEPLPYILGKWEFYGRSFEVNPDVLIPRPETELLVEAALADLAERRRPQRVADVGTGSGCVAITLASEAPGAQLLAADVSRPALRVAQRNARRHAVDREIHFLQMDLLEAVSGRWDLICANLPYLPAGRVAALPLAGHEPRLGLDGGVQGTELMERLLASLEARLAPGGTALMEIDDGQAEPLAGMASDCIPDSAVDVRTDLQGHDRLLVIRRAGAGEH